MPYKQVYQFTKTGGTETWTEVTTGDNFWADTETENQYLNKFGFSEDRFFINDPNYLGTNIPVRNELFQSLVFYDKSLTPTVVNIFQCILYIRIQTEQQGVMFLISKIGDLIFLLDKVRLAMEIPFQHYPEVTLDLFRL